jgi:hypothetical protein
MKIVAALAALTIALLVILNGKPEFSNASRPPRGIVNPVVALQMARDVNDVDAILGPAPSPDREAMRIKQNIDFVFIACYVALYLAMARMFGSRIAMVAAACGVAAGIFDIFENFAILRIVDTALDRTTQAMVDAIRIPATGKWTLTWIALGIFATLFWGRGGWLARSIAVLFGAAALLGIYGLFDNPFLVWAGFPMLGGLILTAIFGVSRRR